MSSPTFSRRSFELLDELAANNHKAWFDAHRPELEQHLLQPFAEVLASVTADLARTKLPLAGEKETMFNSSSGVPLSASWSRTRTSRLM